MVFWFKGGYLTNNTDINIHININNYGLVEDCHHILIHAIKYKTKILNLK